MIMFRTAALRQTLAFAVTALFASACSGPTPADKPATQAAAATAMAAGDEGEFGSGTLSFDLQPDKHLTLPVTFCAGHGTILTIAAQEGEVQVDLRVTELPALRKDKPLEEVTEVGYRFTGSEQDRVFSEIWQTKSMGEVVRDGDTTRASGTMYGLRSYDKGNGVGTTPESIGDRDFSLEVTCSAP